MSNAFVTVFVNLR